MDENVYIDCKLLSPDSFSGVASRARSGHGPTFNPPGRAYTMSHQMDPFL